MSVITVRTRGFKALDRELAKLPGSTGKAAMTRALLEAAEPLARSFRSGAPKATSTLSESIDAGRKLSQRQAAVDRQILGSSRTMAKAYVGAGVLPQAHMQEFGTQHHGPQPFARPAWELGKFALLERIKVEAWLQIRKSLARAERRAAALRR